MTFTKKAALLSALLVTFSAWAGVEFYDSNNTLLGNFVKVKCTTGLTCSQSSGKLSLVTNGSVSGVITPTSGIAASSGQLTRFTNFKPGTLTAGTSTTPSTTTVYLSQIFIPANATLTGIAINNGATVGTDKYVVALFSSGGAVVANSALAGATTSGADSYQSIDFTSTYAAIGPAVYWIALYVNGTTDRFRTIPAAGAYAGLAGSATGQTFGTAASVTLPTTFTADKGPVAFVY